MSLQINGRHASSYFRALATIGLTQPGRGGEVHEVTDPPLMNFARIVAALSAVAGRPIQCVDVPTRPS